MEWVGLIQTNGSEPCRRKAHAFAHLPGTALVIVHGGQDQNNCFLDDIYSFHLDRSEWSRLRVMPGPRPSPRILHTLTAISPTVLVMFGGTSLAATQHANGALSDERSMQTSVCNDVWLFDFRNKAWRLISTTGDCPSPRCAHTAVFGVGRDRIPGVFVFGGTIESGDRRGVVYRLNTKGWSWQQLRIEGASKQNCLGLDTHSGDASNPPVNPISIAASSKFPEFRQGHSSVWVPSMKAMVIFGGLCINRGASQTPLDDLWVLEPGSRSRWRWKRLFMQNESNSLIHGFEGRSGHSMLCLPSPSPQLLIWGGRCSRSSARVLPTFFTHVDLSRRASKQYEAVGLCPRVGRMQFGMALIEGRILLYGGVSENGISKTFCDGVSQILVPKHLLYGAGIIRCSSPVRGESQRSYLKASSDFVTSVSKRTSTVRKETVSALLRECSINTAGKSNFSESFSGKVLKKKGCNYGVITEINGKLFMGILGPDEVYSGRLSEDYSQASVAMGKNERTGTGAVTISENSKSSSALLHRKDEQDMSSRNQGFRTPGNEESCPGSLASAKDQSAVQSTVQPALHIMHSSSEPPGNEETGPLASPAESTKYPKRLDGQMPTRAITKDFVAATPIGLNGIPNQKDANANKNIIGKSKEKTFKPSEQCLPSISPVVETHAPLGDGSCVRAFETKSAERSAPEKSSETIRPIVSEAKPPAIEAKSAEKGGEDNFVSDVYSASAGNVAVLTSSGRSTEGSPIHKPVSDLQPEFGNETISNSKTYEAHQISANVAQYNSSKEITPEAKVPHRPSDQFEALLKVDPTKGVVGNLSTSVSAVVPEKTETLNPSTVDSKGSSDARDVHKVDFASVGESQGAKVPKVVETSKVTSTQRRPRPHVPTSSHSPPMFISPGTTEHNAIRPSLVPPIPNQLPTQIFGRQPVCSSGQEPILPNSLPDRQVGLNSGLHKPAELISQASELNPSHRGPQSSSLKPAGILSVAGPGQPASGPKSLLYPALPQCFKTGTFDNSADPTVLRASVEDKLLLRTVTLNSSDKKVTDGNPSVASCGQRKRESSGSFARGPRSLQSFRPIAPRRYPHPGTLPFAPTFLYPVHHSGPQSSEAQSCAKLTEPGRATAAEFSRSWESWHSRSHLMQPSLSPQPLQPLHRLQNHKAPAVSTTPMQSLGTGISPANSESSALHAGNRNVFTRSRNSPKIHGQRSPLLFAINASTSQFNVRPNSFARSRAAQAQSAQIAQSSNLIANHQVAQAKCVPSQQKNQTSEAVRGGDAAPQQKNSRAVDMTDLGNESPSSKRACLDPYIEALPDSPDGAASNVVIDLD